MTLYYDNDDDCIVENHPDYAAFDDEGRLVLDIDELHDIRAEKVKTLVDVAVSAVEASDEYAVAQEPDIKWVPEDGR
jgi:hypothetical protein